jgi:hypothetical protein
MANPGRKSVDDIQLDERVTQVIELILAGLSTREIVNYTMKDQKWDVCERTIHGYIRKARDYFKEGSAVDRKEQIGTALGRMQRLYTKSLKIQDFKTCLAIQKEISALFGLNAPARTDINLKTNFNIIEPEPPEDVDGDE